MFNSDKVVGKWLDYLSEKYSNKLINVSDIGSVDKRQLAEIFSTHYNDFTPNEVEKAIQECDKENHRTMEEYLKCIHRRLNIPWKR